MAEGEDEIVAGVIKPLSEAGKRVPSQTAPFSEAKVEPFWSKQKPSSEGAAKAESFTARVIKSTAGSDQPK